MVTKCVTLVIEGSLVRDSPQALTVLCFFCGAHNGSISMRHFKMISENISFYRIRSPSKL